MNNRITLRRGPNCWLAWHSGPHVEQIRELFGQEILPLPWTPQATGDEVLADVRRRNPSCEVSIAEETRL